MKGLYEIIYVFIKFLVSSGEKFPFLFFPFPLPPFPNMLCKELITGWETGAAGRRGQIGWRKPSGRPVPVRRLERLGVGNQFRDGAGGETVAGLETGDTRETEHS
jgi:hypothetical protein